MIMSRCCVRCEIYLGTSVVEKCELSGLKFGFQRCFCGFREFKENIQYCHLVSAVSGIGILLVNLYTFD